MNDYCGRFTFASDMTADGVTTVSDVYLWAKAAVLIPSNLVAASLESWPTVRQFFEMDCGTGQGWGGLMFSGFIWLLALVMVASVLDDLRRK